MHSLKRISAMLLTLLLGVGAVAAQDQQGFYKSSALTSFNEGQYQSAIDTLRYWQNLDPVNQGVIAYYMGECYYNLGLESETIEDANTAFESAEMSFQEALASPDLNVSHPDKRMTAELKLAWCSYRMAELKPRSSSAMQAAADKYAELCRQQSEEVQSDIDLMALYTHLQQLEYKINDFIMAGGEADVAMVFRTLLNDIKAVHQSFATVSGREPGGYTASIEWMKIRLTLAKARFYLYMADEQYETILRDNGSFAARDSAVTVITRTLNRLSSTNQPVQTELKTEQLYLELMRYLISPNDQNELAVRSSYASSQQQQLVNLAKGFLVFAKSAESRQFLRVANSQQSEFSNVAIEGRYWLAWAQLMTQNNDCESNFQSFIEQAGTHSDDPHLAFLAEDARLRMFELEFDRSVKSTQRMRQLKNRASSWKPTFKALLPKHKKLLALCSLFTINAQDEDASFGDLTETLLPDESTARLIESAIDLTETVLRSASQVDDGSRRDIFIKYLGVIDRFVKDEYLAQKPTAEQQDLFTFYSALTQYLKAESRSSMALKLKGFETAQDMLEKTTNEKFIPEARYVIARSLKASATFAGAGQTQKLEEAKALLTDLVYQNKSTRALYWLGETYKSLSQFKSAAMCFNAVIQVTENKEGGAYYSQSAREALTLCPSNRNDAVDPVLYNLKVGTTVFPEALLKIKGRVISLEQFADRNAIRHQDKQKAIRLFIQHGWKPLTRKPSIHDLSMVRNDYRESAINFGIDEKLGEITSGLILEVVNAAEISELQVAFGDVLMESDSLGYYSKVPITLGVMEEIRVSGRDVIPFSQTLFFNNAEIKQFSLVLAKRMKFAAAAQPSSSALLSEFALNRLDNNRFFITGSASFTDGTDISTQFMRDIHLRDYCYHPVLKQYLAVRDESPWLVAFNASGKSVRPRITLHGETAAVKPEGIAVDAAGQIFITDWSGHRILVYAVSGQLVSVIGSPGDSNVNEIGELAKLHYPKRIAVIEDVHGVHHGEQKLNRPGLLAVTDRNGIHLVDMTGRFWGSITLSGMDPRNLYDVYSEGYGSGAQLSVFDRSSGQVKTFIAQ